jgi:GNAT superfamily N-acetyltransferase
MSDFAWRMMRPEDIDDVVTVAAASFPDHFETRDCFAERLVFFPHGCFVLAASKEISGYLIAYPYSFGTVPPLNSVLGGLPASSRALYLHDLALHPVARGKDHGAPIITRLFAMAHDRGFSLIHLVAVNGSAGYWRRFGFKPVTNKPSFACKLTSYGDAAIYMVHEL